jgi:hypothetical protein
MKQNVKLRKLLYIVIQTGVPQIENIYIFKKSKVTLCQKDELRQRFNIINHKKITQIETILIF